MAGGVEDGESVRRVMSWSEFIEEGERGAGGLVGREEGRAGDGGEKRSEVVGRKEGSPHVEVDMANVVDWHIDADLAPILNMWPAIKGLKSKEVGSCIL